MKTTALLLPLLALAPLVAARAEDPATNAPAVPPALLVRVASIEEIEKAIRGVADAVGMPALAEEPIRSLREGLAEMGVDVDPSRPVVLALADPRASEEMAVAVPGPEPSAERLAAAFGGATPERGADGVWRQPGAEGNGTAMLRRDGYNVFAHPRERLAFADALLAAAAAPRFPGAALEATVRGEALRTIERELAWAPGVPGPSLAPLETVSFGAAFDASAGLFVPLAATPAESAAGAFEALAAAPALDPAGAIWRDDALFAFAVSDLGTVFGGFAVSFFALTATNYAQNVAFALRRRGADPEEIARAERSAREAIERAEESLALLRSAGAASGFAALAPGGALESVAETAFRDSAAVDRLRARWRAEADGRDVPVEMWVGSATNAFAFRQTDDGWEFGCRPWADGEEPSGPDATGPLAAMRRFFGPDGLRGEVRRVAGPGPGERLVSAVGPAGSPLPAPTGERPPDGAALERFVPGAKRVACVQAHLVDFARFALSPALGDAADALPRGGRFRWDAGVRDGAPVGLFAFDPAELRAWVSLAMLGVSRAMAPAAPAPSGEDALFDD